MGGSTPAAGLGGLANRLIDEHRLRRIAVITSQTTGNPAVGTLDLSAVDLALVVQTPVTSGAAASTSPALAEVQALRGGLDLVIADPFHTYEGSVECIIAATTLLRPGGLLLVHDCLPPPELISPEHMPGSWCGVTFAAFRDLCTANNLPWFTVSNDFGVGVARVPEGGIAQDTPEDAWTPGDHAEYLGRYLEDPFAMMRAVAPDDAGAAVDALLRGAAVGDLLRAFPGWDAALEGILSGTDRTAAQWQDLAGENEQLRLEVQHLADLNAEQSRDGAYQVEQLRLEVQHLTELNAEQRACLIETSRPTWQARAMVRSVPRAIRRRLQR